MKIFKEVAHLYLGCKCFLGDKDWKPTNIPVELQAPYTDPNYGKPYICEFDAHVMQTYLHKAIPILHRLEDLTDNDAVELVALWSDLFLGVQKIDIMYGKLNFKFRYISSNRIRTEQVKFYQLNSDQFLFLLSKHYDLFNLIDNGQAIDAKT